MVGTYIIDIEVKIWVVIQAGRKRISSFRIIVSHIGLVKIGGQFLKPICRWQLPEQTERQVILLLLMNSIHSRHMHGSNKTTLLYNEMNDNVTRAKATVDRVQLSWVVGNISFVRSIISLMFIDQTYEQLIILWYRAYFSTKLKSKKLLE